MNLPAPIPPPSFVQRLWRLPALLIPALSLAQAPDIRTPKPDSPGDGSGAPPPLIEASLDTSYTAAGDADFRGVKRGDSDAFSMSLGLRSRVPLNEKWSLPLGLQSQNLWLDSLADAPVPGRLQTLRFSTGLGCRVNDQWMASLLVSPILYKFEDIGGNDCGLSGGLHAVWKYKPSLTFMLGLMVAPESDWPVIPAAGMNWAINETWDLQLMFPRPRLVCRPAEPWSLHLGADLNMMTFRADDTLGTAIGQPQYNDALGTYRDIRLGAGTSYQFTKSLSVELEGGYSVSRQIDYTRIDERVKFDPAPYGRLGLKASF